MDDIGTTYRVIDLNSRDNVGKTAVSEELAILAAKSSVGRNGDSILVLEQTEWDQDRGRARRSVIIRKEDPDQPWL